MAPAERQPVRLAVIGTGALGRHHVRLAAAAPDAELVGIHDVDPVTARRVGEEFGAPVFPEPEPLLDAVDAVILAVPTVEHCRLGCACLERGLHLLVEKPIAVTLEEAERLVAAAGDRVLAVGHVEYYNPAVEALLDLGGRPGFVEVQRLAAFTPRSLDVDVILDLMIHDLQILMALDTSPVEEVRATGVSVLSDRVDIANARLAFASGCVANVTASRVSSERVRKLRLFLPSSYYSLDYGDQEIKGYRLEGDGAERAIAPVVVDVARDEPLRRELARFLAACRGEPVRYVSGREGRDALAVALRVVEATAEARRRLQEGANG